jgi:hypothetical protein
MVAGLWTSSAALVLAATIAGQPGSLRLTWADGSALAVDGKSYVWCGKWDDGTNVRTLRVQQGSPLSPPWWMFEVRVALARRGHVVRFPVLVGRSATMFAAYPRRQLEASAESERSRGTATILDDVSCQPGTRVRVSVRATLAGEKAGTPSITVRGTFAGTIGTRPGPGVNP